jgi:hypothetical protein
MKKLTPALSGMVFIAMLSGCATLTSVPPDLLYTNVRSPRAYRSSTPADVKATKSDPIVTGRSCNRSLFYLVSWGDNGYAAAVKNALKDDANAILYDVRVDSRVRSVVLGLYTDNCTFLNAKIGQPE